ncbi:MAG: MBL fold metallo-hydrolase [Dehalococcoidia bacterium]|nr:MBL fold metallo-hydrolase [Dehalococcoidia bacterium]MCB9491363.1 MBL fold metallo-hydrolase [Dehalococcoidia bacterium]
MTASNSTADPASAEALPPPEEIVAPSGARGALYRLRTPMTSTALPWVMPYAFVPPSSSDAGVTLFDAGYGTAEATEALTAQLEALGRTPADVQRLIVSHFHPDHVGMAGWLKEQNADLELVMHRADAAIYSGMERGHDHWEQTMRQWGIRHGFDPADLDQAEEERRERREREREHRHQKSEDTSRETEKRQWEMRRVEPARLVEDGEEIAFDGWTLVSQWTPGHTPGHLCIHVPDERLTFTGDHVLSRITPNVSFHPEDEEGDRNPLAEFLASQQKTAELDTRLALPAHEALIDDLPARCNEIIEHHDHRADEVIAGIDTSDGAAGSTAYEIASRVTWNRPWETFSVWKRRSAIGETLAHLRLVETQGRVRRVEDLDGEHPVVRWMPS